MKYLNLPEILGLSPDLIKVVRENSGDSFLFSPYRILVMNYKGLQPNSRENLLEMISLPTRNFIDKVSQLETSLNINIDNLDEKQKKYRRFGFPYETGNDDTIIVAIIKD